MRSKEFANDYRLLSLARIRRPLGGEKGAHRKSARLHETRKRGGALPGNEIKI